MTMLRSTGTVLGDVTVDGGGQAGLTLELSDGNTHRTSQTASSPSGGYEFSGVPPGAYMLRITGAGGAGDRRAPRRRRRPDHRAQRGGGYVMSERLYRDDHAGVRRRAGR